jgi:hypothetical protein
MGWYLTFPPVRPTCPPGMRFRDWVLTLRNGRNTIEITAY